MRCSEELQFCAEYNMLLADAPKHPSLSLDRHPLEWQWQKNILMGIFKRRIGWILGCATLKADPGRINKDFNKLFRDYCGQHLQDSTTRD